MVSHKDRSDLLGKLWIILGAILGTAAGLGMVAQRTRNIFPQFGNYEKILYVILLGYVGLTITRQCQPTKKALIGGVIVPLLFSARLFFTSPSLPFSPKGIISLIFGGILVGILLGTAWAGALIGAFITALLTIMLSFIVRGNIEWTWILFFAFMGAIGSAWVQLSFKKTAWQSLRRDRNRNKVPEWLEQTALEKKSEETGHEST